MNYVRRAVFKLLVFMNPYHQALMVWAAKAVLSPTVMPVENTEYVQPLESINVLSLSAAITDHCTTPENCQSTLNACLESLRSPQISDRFFAMFGSLIAQFGYTPQEALLRVLSNAICIGMHLNRRLS